MQVGRRKKVLAKPFDGGVCFAVMALTKAERKLLAKLGRKGGKRRVANMTPEELSKANTHASNVRWGKTKPKPEAAA